MAPRLARPGDARPPEVRGVTSNDPLMSFPVTPVQSGIMFDCLQDAATGLYHSQTTLLAPEDLDLDRWVEAWRQVGARHESLRLRFQTDGDRVLQVVLPSAEPDVRYLDWTGLTAAQAFRARLGQ